MDPAIQERIREIAWEFHCRAFGEEMARVNFLPLAERQAYLNRLRERVGRRGKVDAHDTESTHDAHSSSV